LPGAVLSGGRGVNYGYEAFDKVKIVFPRGLKLRKLGFARVFHGKGRRVKQAEGKVGFLGKPPKKAGGFVTF
jgi:hypothetical protein